MPDPRRFSLRLVPFATVLALALMPGCIALIPYEPNERFIEALGGENEARDALSDALERTIQPIVASVEVHEGYIEISYAANTPPNQAREVHLDTLQRIDIYENNVAHVWNMQNQIILNMQFQTGDDVKSFADLLWSFRALERERAKDRRRSLKEKREKREKGEGPADPRKAKEKESEPPADPAPPAGDPDEPL